VMASSVDRRIEGDLPEDMGQCDPASLIRPRSTEPIGACGRVPRLTGRTHDRKRPAVQTREKVLASRGPSTHVLGPANDANIGRHCEEQSDEAISGGGFAYRRAVGGPGLWPFVGKIRPVRGRAIAADAPRRLVSIMFAPVLVRASQRRSSAG
jgi:hypothetical protein